MSHRIVSRILSLIVLLVCALAVTSGEGETFKLANGQELTGEMLPTSANDNGVQIKVGEGQYQRVAWADFSQEDLKRFAQNTKLQALVEPFIEITEADKIKQTQVDIKQPPRLSRPALGSVFGAMFSSPLGLFLMLVLYAAIIYAGYEVAIFRAQPPMVVAGLSAIPFLGILAPIAFLSMPTKLKASEQAAAEGLPAAAPPAGEAAPATDEVNPMLDPSAAHPAGLKIAHEEQRKAEALPEPIVYARGQFTFNRRFFETKFPGFFGVVRREADKDMVIIIRATRGTYAGRRFSRISANDLHLEVHHPGASEEVMIPYIEIQEVRLQHKDTKA